jgi:hypothetical protein
MIKITSSLGVISLLSSCFVALPTPSTSITKIYQGKVVKASCNIYVFERNPIDGNLAIDGTSPIFKSNSKHSKFTAIPAGTELTAKRTVYRRLPADVVTSLVCHSKDQNITFEISESDISKWHLSVVNPESEQAVDGNPH